MYIQNYNDKINEQFGELKVRLLFVEHLFLLDWSNLYRYFVIQIRDPRVDQKPTSPPPRLVDFQLATASPRLAIIIIRKMMFFHLGSTMTIISVCQKTFFTRDKIVHSWYHCTILISHDWKFKSISTTCPVLFRIFNNFNGFILMWQ